jgi:hypothetical protein
MRAFARLVVLCVVAAGFSADAFAQCGAIPIVSPSGSNVPLNGAGTVSLKWQAVSGATSYDIYFGTPGQACNANSPHGTVSAPTTDWSPPSNEISRGATYEWRVKANGAACPTPPVSSCTTFTTAACPAVAPTLSAPANNTQVAFGTVTLQWSTVANATGYEIYVGVDGGALTSIGTTTASQKTIVVGAGRTIRWYVAALSGQCPSVAAQTFTFTTTCPTGAPSLRSPDSGSQFAIGTAIAFSWTALAGATSYDLQASVAGANSFETVAENITATSFTKAVPQGNWNWRVRANFDGNCPPAYSTTRSFSVSQACDNHAPELLEPNDHATTKSPVTFKWTSVSAKDYLLYAQKAGAAEPLLLTKTTRTDFSATLDAGVYEWAVVAEYENCPVVSSAKRTLTIEAPREECGDARIELKTPAENASTTSGQLSSSRAPPPPKRR